MKILDIKDSPGFNPAVKNGNNSVSEGKIILKQVYPASEASFFPEYPHCINHGALNKVSNDGLWRCLTCHEGCFQVE